LKVEKYTNKAIVFGDKELISRTEFVKITKDGMQIIGSVDKN